MPDNLPKPHIRLRRRFGRAIRRCARKFWIGLHRIPPDLGWYGLAAAGALAGFLIQITWKSARDAGVGAIVIMIGIGVGFGRYAVSRITRLGNTVGVSPISLADNPALSPLVLKLYGQEVNRHRLRVESLRDGAVTMRGQAEMLEYLDHLSKAAEEEMWAVDFISLEQWLGNPMFRHYLDVQLSRAKDSVVLNRVRMVRRQELADDRHRVLLREFIRRHEDVKANLKLCYFDVGQSINDLIFFPPQGTLIIDPRSACPGCLAGRLGDAGYIETATVFLRDGDQLRRNIADWRLLWNFVTQENTDAQVRHDLEPYDGIDRPFEQIAWLREVSTAAPLLE